MNGKVIVLCGALLFLLQTAPAPVHAGSMFDQHDPLELDLNTTVAGGYSDDHPTYNYFRVSLETDGDFRVTHSAGGGYVYLQVYSADPEANGINIIPYQYGDGDDDNARLYALQAGTYTIRAENHLVDTTSYTLTTSYSAASLGNDPEPNDTQETASPLPTGEVTGHLGYAYDAWGGMPVYNSIDGIDMWKITTLTDGYLTVEVTRESTLGFDPYLYDDDMEIVSAYYDSDNHDNVEYQVAAGTYYFSTKNLSGFGSYTLTTSFVPASLGNDPEPNDTRQEAAVLPVNDTVAAHLGFCTDGDANYRSFDTYDWWTVTTAGDGLLTITTGAADDFGVGPVSDIYLYDEDGTLLLANYNSDKSPTVQSALPLAAGTYTVRIRNLSGYGSYTITSDLAPASLADDYPDNDYRNGSMPMSAGTPVTGHLGYQSGTSVDTYDFWELMIDETDTVTITLESGGDTDDPLVMNLYIFDGSGGYVLIDYNTDSLALTERVIEDEPGPVYIRAGRKSGYGSYTLSAAIQAAEPLVITTSALGDALAGTIFSQAVTVENVLDEVVSFALLDGPAWLSIDGNGMLSGTPEAGDAGTAIPVSIAASTPSRADTLVTTINVLTPNAVDGGDMPQVFSVDHPRPNPFNAATTIRFRVPVECRAQMAVYDILGRKIADLVDGRLSPGIHEVVWDGRDIDGASIGSGVYLYRFAAGEYVHTGKVMLLQ